MTFAEWLESHHDEARQVAVDAEDHRIKAYWNGRADAYMAARARFEVEEAHK